MSRPPADRAPPSREPTLTAGDAARKVAQVGVVFVSLFLIVRALFLEPFGVPTGSMAETLLGNRREADCSRCGFPGRVGVPTREREARFDRCRCPNCGEALDLSAAPEIAGDRLLVDKTAYHYRSPRRWEVAVFRCPVDDSKPYVKRVVGLPGETVQVIDGDVYANGELLRKTLAQSREIRVPVFDIDHAPPEGWGLRWLVEPVADTNTDRIGKALPAEPTPAGPDVLAGGVLALSATGNPGQAVGLTYHHWQFDSNDDDPIRDTLGYNDAMLLSRRAAAVHDFILECELEVISGAGVFACRLGDGADFVNGDLPVGEGSGGARLAVHPNGATAFFGSPAVSEGTAGCLQPGRIYRLEFAFVDRRASLAVDGVEVVPPLDLPPASRRGEVRRPLQLGARGVEIRLRNLKLFRDVHYRTEGEHGTRSPHRLGPDEYFVLGDNSPDSHDSRGWSVPGVPERDFIGKPFLIHQPLRIGQVGVNGRVRAVQSVDWDRLRWLR